MRVWSILFFLLGFAAFGAKFPAVKGAIHNPQKVDLSSLTIEITVACRDPGTMECGSATQAAVMAKAKDRFEVPAFEVGPARKEGETVKGLGNRFTISAKIALPGLTQFVVVHDISYFAFENQRSYDLKALALDYEKGLANLTVYPIDATAHVSFPPKPEWHGRYGWLRYQKQFIGASGHHSEIGRAWIKHELNTKNGAREAAIPIPPMLFFLRGKPSDYGTPPQVKTVVAMFVPIKRGDSEELALEGRYEEPETEYSEQSHFSSAEVAIEEVE
jgi:hypothetical protein